MALPLAPIAVTALKYGAVAVTAYGIARRIGPGRIDQKVEDAMDTTPEGVTLNRPGDREGQTNASARFRRVIRLGRSGPGVEVDFTGLTRIRVRRAPR